jgi:hypothetical protein
MKLETWVPVEHLEPVVERANGWRRRFVCFFKGHRQWDWQSRFPSFSAPDKYTLILLTPDPGAAKPGRIEIMICGRCGELYAIIGPPAMHHISTGPRSIP